MTLNQNNLNIAIELAMQCFKNEKAKDRSPTILHSLSVMIRVSRIIPENCILYYPLCIAAVLHDVLEDCPENEREFYTHKILTLFGEHVLILVQLLTKTKSTNYWEYLASLVNNERKEACIIKFCDMLDNLDRCQWLDEKRKTKMTDKYVNGIHFMNANDFIKTVIRNVSENTRDETES